MKTDISCEIAADESSECGAQGNHLPRLTTHNIGERDIKVNKKRYKLVTLFNLIIGFN
jgi:hypothetical protein